MCQCNNQMHVCPECGTKSEYQSWKKENFHYHGGYLMYNPEGDGPYGAGDKFVARFKYGKPARSAATWKTFLVKHFTPAEYFGRLANRETPLEIMRSKGYELPHVRAIKAAAV